MGRVIVVDIETSGTSRTNDRVIEIGAVEVLDGRISGREFQSLINPPGCRIHPAAQRVHGISSFMLAGEPRPEIVFPRFAEFLGDALFVAHNAPFDFGFIREELARLRLHLGNPVECSLRRSRRVLTGIPKHTLDAVYAHLGGPEMPGNQRHRAIGDARMAAFVWCALGRLG